MGAIKVYLDSSFLVSLYLKDQHSPEAHARMALDPVVWLTPLNVAEFFHAVGQQVFFGKVSAVEAEKVHENLTRDRAAGVWLETGMPEQALERTAELGRRYGPKLGIRTIDSLHVACALELKAERFWTFDERQKKLANAEGLRVA